MAQRKTAELPLHGGKAPPWLFQRMVQMAGAIATLIVRDSGPTELLRRLSDPFWFQAFGCVIGFDWHSSGVTTTVCGALKEAARHYGQDMGIVVCGGKGLASRKTPEDIQKACDRTGDKPDTLIYASRMAAKVDNSAVQDSYQLYHHVFFFAPGGQDWCVVQQGMNPDAKYARRYHWLSQNMSSFVSDPHAAVACDIRSKGLNLVAGESDAHRNTLAMLSREHPDRILREIKTMLTDKALPLFDRFEGNSAAFQADYHLPTHHTLATKDINPAALKKVLIKTYEKQAADFEGLLGEPGIGP